MSQKGMKMDTKAKAYGEISDKPGILDEIISLLRKLLDFCLCCVTCGCYPGRNRHFNGDLCEMELMEDEKEAVHNLLTYLDSEHSKSPTINEQRLRALCILTYSDNEELQRSAALCYAEISEKMTEPVSEIVMEPLVTLLRSKDTQVQKAASLAMSNFSLNGPESNKKAIVESGAVPPLVQLLSSSEVEVQCNACGCLTTLATIDKTKRILMVSGGVPILLQLATSSDVRVQRNATGAFLNLTHQKSNRNELVQCGALPTLVDVLNSSDTDVQYYCAAALSNLAVDERHRTMMVAIGRHDVIRRLIQLLSSSKEKVKCQACLSLRNLASDGDNQVLIVKLGGLHPLHQLMNITRGETLIASLACLRNLSIHKSNELDIIGETFLSMLKRVIRDPTVPDAQNHAAGTIRNLAAGEQIELISESGCVESLCDVLMSSRTTEAVLVEVTAALAVLSDEDSTRDKLLNTRNGNVFRTLVHLSSKSPNANIQYNCAGTVGQIAVLEIPPGLLQKSIPSILNYLYRFLNHQDTNFVHIALWTLMQLFKESSVRAAFIEKGYEKELQRILRSQTTEAIKELARNALTKLM